MTRPIHEYTPPRDAGHRNFRISQVERKAGGGWVYVVLTPTSPDASPESPLFENNWDNLGGDWTPLRFRWLLDGQVEIEGAVTGGAAGTTIFTLPGLYIRDFDILVPGVNEADNTLAVFKIEAATGAVSLVA